jgi:hypothetical protein
MLSLAVLAAMMMIAACGKDDDKKDPAPPQVADSPNNGKRSEDFSQTEKRELADEMMAILDDECVSCHGSENPANGLDFTKQSVIEANVVAIANAVIDGRMPKDAAISDGQLIVIVDWKSADYPLPGDLGDSQDGGRQDNGGDDSGKDDSDSDSDSCQDNKDGCQGEDNDHDCYDKGDCSKDGDDPKQNDDDHDHDYDHKDYEDKKQKWCDYLERKDLFDHFREKFCD